MLPIAKKIQAIFKHVKETPDVAMLRQFEGLSASEATKLAVKVMADFIAQPKLSMQDALSCLLKLDETMQTHLEQLTAKRLKIKIYNRDVGAAIDGLVYPYYRRLSSEYLRLLKAIEGSKSPSKPIIVPEVLVYCRAMNALFKMMKWRYFDDQPAPAEGWYQVHELFKRAEKSSLLYERVLLYPTMTKPVDIATLMANGLMLSTLQKENYNPNELHIVSKLLFDWVRQISFEKAYAQNKYQYFVNLNQDKGAERIRAFDRTADYRFWRTDFITLKIADHLAAIKTNAPDIVNDIRGYASLRTMAKLFKKLSHDWATTSYKRQRRAKPRDKLTQRLLVTSGLQQICKQLARFHQQSARPNNKLIFDVRITNLNHVNTSSSRNIITGLDEWVLINMSENGFGVDLGKDPSPWAEAGKLVGFQHPCVEDAYVIAEIKYIKRQKSGAYRAGLQLISLQSLTVQLIKLDQSQVELSKGFFLDYDDANADMMRVPCVWIPAGMGQAQVKSSVIIPISEYQRNRQFKIDLNGEEKTIVLGVAMDMQTEWVRATVAAIH